MGKASRRRKFVPEDKAVYELSQRECDLMEAAASGHPEATAILRARDEIARNVARLIRSRSIAEASVLILESAHREIDARNAGIIRGLERQAQLPQSIGTIACANGCAYCCHIPVQVFEIEVVAIIDHVTKNWTTPEKSALRMRIEKHNEAAGNGLKLRPCPFLDASNRCSVYAIRPLVCRTHHSLSVDECRKAFEGDPQSEIPKVSNFDSESVAFFEGIRKGLNFAGLRSSMLDFVPALSATFETRIGAQ